MSHEWVRPNAPLAPAPPSPPGVNMLAFMLAHVGLAISMHYVSFVSAIHAGLTLAIACRWALTDLRLERVAYISAYITGAEVLWRMTDDQLPWELGKYAVTLVCLIAAFRTDGRVVAWAAAAFALLLPSAWLTVSNYDAAEARNQLSFNLSGPLAMCACAAFFSRVHFTPEGLQRWLLSLMAPVTGIAAITFFRIATNPALEFSHQSNFALSGGFGPNQVSAALGLGCLAALLLLFESGVAWFLRLAAAAFVLWFGLQSALTFSRGGLFSAAGAVMAGLFWRASDPRALFKSLAVGIVVVTVGYTVFWPQLDRFTGGNLGQRFQETDTSLRADLGAADMQLWRDNRLLGVGPGRSKLGHLDDITSHTEFTRLLAEHGMFGAAVLLLMTGAAFHNTWRGATGREKGVAASCAVWAILFMLNSAMRLVAPSLMFGASFAIVLPLRAAVTEKRPELAPRWLFVSSR